MLINGDDGLVRSTGDFLPVWKSIAASIGLQPSVGKTYTHKEYCNINSTAYIFKDGQFFHVPYVNMGLVVGNTRSGSKVDSKSIFCPDDGITLGARHRELMKTCPPKLRLAVHELFLEKNHDTLSSVYSIPWYLPEELGGVGLEPLIEYSWGEHGDVDDVKRSYMRTSWGHKCGPTKKDVMIAWSLRDKQHRGLVVGKVPSLQPVQARPVWSSVIYRHLGSRELANLTEDEETFLDLSAFICLPSEVTKRIDSAHRLEILRRNERVWSSLYRDLGDISNRKEELFL
jgi:hypothetical protein